MSENQVMIADRDLVKNQENLPITPGKKKASWFRTILWMLSMVILVNMVMAIIAYVLYRYKII